MLCSLSCYARFFAASRVLILSKPSGTFYVVFCRLMFRFVIVIIVVGSWLQCNLSESCFRNHWLRRNFMVRVTFLKFAGAFATVFVMTNTQTTQRFWETRFDRLDMMTTRSPLWAPVTTRYATRTCRWSVSRTSFVFPTSLVSRVERVHLIRTNVVLNQSRPCGISRTHHIEKIFIKSLFPGFPETLCDPTTRTR